MNQEKAWGEVIQRRGYIVLGNENELRPGDVAESRKYDRGDIRQPMYVISRTTEADMIEQSEIFKEVGYGPSWTEGFEYYYRVSTD